MIEKRKGKTFFYSFEYQNNELKFETVELVPHP